MFASRVARSGDRVALRHKDGGAWKTTSWNEWAARSRRIALGLAAKGVEPGERVAVLSSTRIEWVLADLGILLAGGVTVPIYPSSLPDQCEYILANSESRAVVVEDTSHLAKIERIRPRLPSLAQVVVLSGEGGGATTLAELEAAGERLADSAGLLERRAAAVHPSAPATFVYTSGTTGPPKGVVLTHENFCFECAALSDCLPIGEDDEQLLFLPLAHIFAKILYLSSIHNGSRIAFAESIEKVVQNFSEVRPTFVGSVPRIYEKVYTKVTGAAQQAGGLRLRVFQWATATGRRNSLAVRQGRKAGGLGYALAHRLVFRKIEALFGGRLRFFISGGAPLSREIAEFFHAAGLLILEGYGLTETTAATHVNRIDRYRFGTVGLPLPGVEAKLAADGEVLLRGRNMMAGYHQRPEDTRETVDADGWLHSGDIGEIDADGFLRITDRKKDIIVTAGGKNIAPQNIEGLLKSDPLISQVMVHGDKRPYCVALVTLNEEALRGFARENGLDGGPYSELTQHPRVREAVERIVDEKNRSLASYETVKRFAILPHDFTQETGELTPTLKVKRKFATQKYWDVIENLYRGGPG
jgi:long-chain acyl-CoA synthetase